MTDLRKAAEMALEALKNGIQVRAGEGGTKYQPDLEDAAIAALEAALAQPEQTKCPRCGEVNPAEIHTCSPQVAQSDNQEPVAYMSIVKKDSAFDKFRFTQSDMYPTPVYTAPPSKQWVGLTDEEREQATGWSVEHIEARLKEKNGA